MSNPEVLSEDGIVQGTAVGDTFPSGLFFVSW